MSRSLYLRLMHRFEPDRTFSPERREALRTILSAGAAIALGSCAGPMRGSSEPRPTPRRAGAPRVAVIGGGLAGLACACELVGSGIEPVVIEARGRIGGRVLSFRDWIDGAAIEGGGELIGANHPQWLRHARLFGLEFSDVVESDLEAPIHLDGRLLSSAESEALWEEMDRAVNAMNDLARTVDPEAPWSHNRAEALDNQHARDWIEALDCSGLCKHALGVQFAADNAVPVERQSLLAHLAMVKAGGVQRYWTESEVFRCAGGNDALATNLAQVLGPERLRLRSPALSIDASSPERAVRVGLAGGTTIEADAVVVAAPSSVLRNIRFKPELPTALARAQMGVAVKRLTTLDRRVWLDADRAPDSLSDRSVSMTWEPTHATGPTATSKACLTAFSGGPAATSLRRMASIERDRQILAELDGLYPGFKANAGEGRWMDWPAETFIRCGYSFPAPGELTTIGRLWIEPACNGRVLFAGEHTSAGFPGYMEGALASGIRSARQAESLLAAAPEPTNQRNLSGSVESFGL